jgi:pSer/pThr/pTyr-binding forkhead associated (FHA) protein
MPSDPSDNDETADRTIFIDPARAAAAVPAPDALGHYLVMIGGIQPGKRVEIGAVPVTIGRSSEQTLALADAELSRHHARVSLVNGGAVAEDLGSTNGTFVDAQRLTGALTLREGNVLRVGSQLLKYERRSRPDVVRSQELDRDLLKASNYVLSQLPAPLESGPVRTEWRFVPSTQLGGDAFGYDWLDPDAFMFYLLDVSGHGVGAAMHSVTVLSVLRQRALPHVDFKNPAEVLASLNDRFPMDGHSGMFLTMWYGVYSVRDRTLTYGSAGHHPAYLVPLERNQGSHTRAAEPIGGPAMILGAMPGYPYEMHQITLPAGSALYLFSDGVFEIVTSEGGRWALSDFLPRLVEPPLPGVPEAERLYRSVRQAARPGPLEDDFSLMVLTFP